MHLHELTIASFREGLLNKEFSAFEITEAYFKHIEERDGRLHAYLSLLKDGALANAEKTDLAVAEGKNIPPLSGVPLAVKDNILIEGAVTTAASKILEQYVASYDATAIKKLKERGAVFLGKTNLDEFAMGSST